MAAGSASASASVRVMATSVLVMATTGTATGHTVITVIDDTAITAIGRIADIGPAVHGGGGTD